MTEKLEVQFTGRSKYEVATMMADKILITLENKTNDKISRKEYLATVAECIAVLDRGSNEC
jgi:hypothetical protein